MNTICLCVLSSLFVVGVVSRMCPGSKNCECREIGHSTLIYCSPVQTMQPVTEMLRDHFSTKRVSLLQLSSCNVHNFTDDVFPSSNISSIRLLCPVEEVEDRTFVQVRMLIKLSFMPFGMTKIPDAISNLNSLQSLVLTRHKIEALDSELWELKSLEVLTIKYGKLKSVSDEAFKFSANLTVLSFANNLLSMLNQSTFDPLLKLRSIDLSGNNLYTMDGVLSKLNPKVINLYGNGIVNVTGLLHDGMWKVESLQLGHNSITKFDSSCFKGTTPNVNLLDLSYNHLSTLDTDLFQNIRQLNTLLIDSNMIEELPRGTFRGLDQLMYLDVKRNLLPSTTGLFTDLPALETLDLSYNKLTSLGGMFHNLTRFNSLNLAGNTLTNISRQDFDPIPTIRMLDLSVNLMQHLESDVFVSLTNLVTLNISYNPFKTFNSSLRQFSVLQVLYAESCRIQYLSDFDFSNLTHLNRIVLTNNNISAANGAFRNMPGLRSISIDANRLETLSRDTFTDDLMITELYLGDNPWSCDCRLLWLVEWMSKSGSTVLKDKPYCTSPQRLEGMMLSNLSLSNITEWLEDCPDSCKCECVLNKVGYEFYVRVNCSNDNLSEIPEHITEKLGELLMNKNRMNSTESLNRVTGSKLKLLDLSENAIVDANSTAWPVTLEVLLLSNNRLQRIDFEAFNSLNLTELTLGGNPWKCDCEAIPFRKWLLENKTLVHDSDNVRCGDYGENHEVSGKMIILLSDRDLCPESGYDIYFIIGVSIFGAMLLISVSCCLIACCCCRRVCFTVRVWLYSRGVAIEKRYHDDSDGKEYDVLLSYASADSHLARNVIAETLRTQTPSFSVCDPNSEENFDPVESIRVTRRIVAILSPEYLEDVACMTMFRTSYNLHREAEITDGIIIVRYGTLPSLKSLDDTVREIFKSGPHLVWGERLFWEKLYYLLPSPMHETMSNELEDRQQLIVNS